MCKDSWQTTTDSESMELYLKYVHCTQQIFEVKVKVFIFCMATMGIKVNKQHTVFKVNQV